MIEIRLLGKLQVQHAEEDLTPRLSRKTLALLGYLCASRGSHRRGTLADLFCATADDPSGTLRWHLSRIRKALGDRCLVIERDSVSFGEGTAQLDLVLFERVLGGERSSCPDALLDQALGVYRGELMEGLKINDAADFDLWLLAERNRLKVLYEQGLEERYQRFLQQGRKQEALIVAQILCQSEPLREENHATLIALYKHLGQHEAAQRQFQHCQKIFAEELGIAPLQETQALLLRTQLSSDASQELGSRWQTSTQDPENPSHRKSIPPPKTNLSIKSSDLQQTEMFAEEKKRVESTATSAFWIGRRQEEAMIRGLWSHKQTSGSAEMLVISASAGGGKTRFVEEMAIRCQTTLWRGACYASERTHPYHPWRDLFDGVHRQISQHERKRLPQNALAQVAALYPSLVDGLDILPSLPPQDGSEMLSLSAAVRVFFSRLSPPQGAWLLLEDLQWADEASLHFLTQLLRETRDYPLFLLATYAPEEAEEGGILQRWLQDLARRQQLQTLYLPLLTKEEINEWLAPRSLLSAEERAVRASLLHETSQGLPLFLYELWRSQPVDESMPFFSTIPQESDDHILQKGFTDPPSIAFSVPPSQKALLERKFGQCQPSSRQVFEVMAVWETPLTLAQALRASARSEEEVLQALEEGERLGLCRAMEVFVSPPRYQLQSRMLAATIRAQLTAIRLRLLHRRIARSLEDTGGQVTKIAYHWSHAQEQEKAAHYTIMAGKNAARSAAYGEALQCFSRALLVLQDPFERVQLLRMRGEIEQRIGQQEESIASLEQAMMYLKAIPQGEEAQRECALCEVLLGRWKATQNDWEQALALFQRARVGFLALKDHVRLCTLLGEMGRIYRLRGRYEEARLFYQEQLSTTEKITSSPFTQARLRGDALGALSLLWMQQGDFEEALQSFEQMLATYQPIPQTEQEEIDDRLAGSLTISKVMLGAGRWKQDAYMRALHTLEEQFALAFQVKEAPTLLRDLSHLSAMFIWVGDYPRAFIYLQKHFALAFAQQSLAGLCRVVGDMAALYGFLGEKESSKRCYTYRLALGLDLGDRRSVATSLGRLAVLLSEEGRYEEAESLLSPAMTLCAHHGFSSDLSAFRDLADGIARPTSRTDTAARSQEEAVDLKKTEEENTETIVKNSNLSIQKTAFFAFSPETKQASTFSAPPIPQEIERHRRDAQRYLKRVQTMLEEDRSR